MNRFIILLSLVQILSHVTPSIGYGTGAPSVSCEDLVPKHGVSPQTSPSPYKILLDKTTVYLNTPLNITLTSKNGQDDFKGFLVQVREVVVNHGTGGAPSKPNLEGGLFLDDPKSKNARALVCSNKHNLAMTHKNSDNKRAVTVQWLPKIPGQYRVHATFVKDKGTFWVNQIDDQIIEVLDPTDQVSQNPQPQTPTSTNDHSHHYPSGSMNSYLCSTMKFNDPLEILDDESNPFIFSIGAFKGGHDDNPHKIYQKGWMWINITSDIGTPIWKAFIQIRPQQQPAAEKMSAVGKFVPYFDPDSGVVSLVDCFGGMANGAIFENRNYKKKAISDVSFLWEAPEHQVGDFVVIGSVSNEEAFWGKIGDDPETAKIKVVKNPSLNNNATEPEPGKQHVSSSSCVLAANTLTLYLYITYLL